MSFNTPILFLLFNRPKTTLKVFESIREIKPTRLYVAADGPRLNRPGEEMICEKVRLVIDKVDWPCEVRTLFRDENLGCKIAVSSAITWFFDNEEEGIILEDDCLPNQSFYQFCETLLLFYREDERIMHISGNNFQDGKIIGDGSYYFSNIHHIWGWATWKRAWQYYDMKMNSFETFINEGYLKSLYPETYYQQVWLDVFKKIKEEKLNTWDYQLTFSIWVNNGLGIVPNKNLVSNIGFTAEATHTITSGDINLENRKTEEMKEVIHPTIIQRNYIAEKYTLDNYIVKGRINKIKLWLKSKFQRET